MRLTVVGSAPAYTSRSGCASSCYLVEHDRTAIVLDLGQGTFSELWRYRSPGAVDAVVISHLHADHCVDLIPLRHWVRYENGGRGPALHGPAELRARFSDFQARYGEPQARPDFFSDLSGAALEPGVFQVGALSIEARRVTHIPDSFGFRVSVAGADRPGLVYSGDCSVADDLVPLIRSGDTLLCEAALGLGGADGGPHLTVDDAVGAARAGRAARLFLTHVLDRHDEAAVLRSADEALAGAVELAVPGLSIDIR